MRFVENPRALFVLVAGFGLVVPACLGGAEPTGSVADAISGVEFEDLATLASTANPCLNGWNVDNCYNEDLPPEPAYMRSQVVNKQHFSWSPGHDIQQSNTKWWGTQAPSSTLPQTWQLGTRSSLDGRVNILNYGHSGAIGIFYPENLDYGFQTKYDKSGNQLEVLPLQARRNVSVWMRFSHDTGMSEAQIDRDGVFYGATGGSDLCNAGDASRPYPCTAFSSASPSPYGDPRVGSCYDLYVISSFVGAKMNLGESPELRSSALTIFAENAEQVPRANEQVERKVYIYPRSTAASAPTDSSGRVTLPDFNDYNAYSTYISVKNALEAALPPPPPGEPAPKVSPWLAVYTMDDDHCGVTGEPAWCDYFDNQDYNNNLNVPDETLTKWGDPSQLRAIEMSTTGDGKILIGQDARSGGIGLFYSYSPNACDVDGWTTFKPLSRAYTDTNINDKYGFAEYPVTYPDGSQPAVGERVGGAYPWIDRAGTNIFIGGHTPTFGWKACEMDEAGGEHTTAGDCSIDVTQTLNGANAKAPKVFGLWTRGKIIHLDGVVNGSDWTARETDSSATNDKHFFVAAFHDAPWVKVRPGNNTDFFTYENIFNHLDHMTPLLPNDVVWTVTAGSNKVNAEVPFDDYMTKEALVLAPMIDRLKMVPNWTKVTFGTWGVPIVEEGVWSYRRENGMDMAMFVCHDGDWSHEDCPNMTGEPGFVIVRDVRGEQYAGTDIFLQNNANPAGTLPELSLRGGAFIPPISTGVIGKAVYLDGINDRIEIDHLPTNVSSYYVSLWVEPTDGNTRTLLSFPDNSAIQLSSSSLWFLHSPSGSYNNCYTNGTVEFSAASIPTNDWTHLGFAFDGSGSGNHNVDVFVNGELVDTVAVSGFSIAPQSGRQLTVGQDRDSCWFFTMEFDPVRAWIDELKLFRLSAGEYGSDQLRERACNHALGSLLADGSCEQIGFRTSEALDVYGAGSGLEFPLEAYRQKDCGSSAHRNYGSVGAGQCDRGNRLSHAELNPNVPRPNFHGNQFCEGCHDSNGPKRMSGDDIIDFDLSDTALDAEPWHTATEDRRRQPLFWPQPVDHILWDGSKNVRIGCGVGFHEVGRFATWWGKVNLHREPDGDWVPDGDCSSGANIKGLGYCQKFWNATTLHRTVLGSELKPFVTGGCGMTFPSRGHEEWVCCEQDP